MEKPLEVCIAAGGTAGHINPALALAEELTDRGHHVRFVGQPTRLEAELVPAAGFDFIPIEVTGFNRRKPWTLVTALVRMARARKQLGKRFAEEGAPDVAVGFGAYVELALLSWCVKNGVPTVLHEQNSVPGLANLTCAKKANCLCLSFPEAEKKFKGRTGKDTQVVFTGNPVRRVVREATREEGRNFLGIPEDATMLLVFGGSLGARHVNEAVCALKSELLSRGNLYIVHSTGKALYDEVCEALALTDEEAARWQVLPYIERMGEALAAADVVLSRAGASSIAEIAALGVPSLLVPYPLATEDHQTTNAHLLVDAGAAVAIPDSEIDGEAFANELFSLVDDADRRAAMRAAAQGLGQERSAALVADRVEEAALGKTAASLG